MAKNTGKVREFCQSGKVGTLIVLINNHKVTKTKITPHVKAKAMPYFCMKACVPQDNPFTVAR